MKKLNFEEIECLVRELNDYEAKILSIEENLKRSDLLPMEEAAEFYSGLKSKIEKEYKGKDNLPAVKKERDQKIRTIVRKSHDDPIIKSFAKELGWSSKTIARRLSLRILPEEIQNKIARKDK